MDNYRKNIEEFPEQLSSRGLLSSHFEKLSHTKPEHIVIAGMGGSGLAGEIVKDFKKELGITLPITIWKDYSLPEIKGRTLCIFSSFSGNTEETLSGFREALRGRKKFSVAVLTTGGELERLARQKKVPLLTFRAGTLTPRQSTGKMFYGLIEILRSTRISVNVPLLPKISAKKFERPAKALSHKLKQRLIHIYTDQKHKSLGYIWKIKFNETAKTSAFANVMPEMNHNETVSFEKPRFKSAALFIEDNDVNARVLTRFALTEKLLKARGVAVHRLKLQGKNEFEKIWGTLILADWTSYFLAKLTGADPRETKIIDALKKLLR